MVAVADKVQTLTLNDRCDAGGCSAAALIQVSGITGELFFCGHHYNKYENTEGMKKFAFDIIDDRWTIQNENRLED